jgi:hypothetical protein
MHVTLPSVISFGDLGYFPSANIILASKKLVKQMLLPSCISGLEKGFPHYRLSYLPVLFAPYRAVLTCSKVSLNVFIEAISSIDAIRAIARK